MTPLAASWSATPAATVNQRAARGRVGGRARAARRRRRPQGGRQGGDAGGVACCRATAHRVAEGGGPAGRRVDSSRGGTLRECCPQPLAQRGAARGQAGRHIHRSGCLLSVGGGGGQGGGDGGAEGGGGRVGRRARERGGRARQTNAEGSILHARHRGLPRPPKGGGLDVHDGGQHFCDPRVGARREQGRHPRCEAAAPPVPVRGGGLVPRERVQQGVAVAGGGQGGGNGGRDGGG